MDIILSTDRLIVKYFFQNKQQLLLERSHCIIDHLENSKCYTSVHLKQAHLAKQNQNPNTAVLNV